MAWTYRAVCQFTEPPHWMGPLHDAYPDDSAARAAAEADRQQHIDQCPGHFVQIIIGDDGGRTVAQVSEFSAVKRSTCSGNACHDVNVQGTLFTNVGTKNITLHVSVGMIPGAGRDYDLPARHSINFIQGFNGDYQAKYSQS